MTQPGEQNTMRQPVIVRGGARAAVRPEHGEGDGPGIRLGPEALAPRDPVCGAPVSSRKLRSIYRGREHAFCSLRCLERFLSAPSSFPVEGEALPPHEEWDPW
jgi:YHS domain-containing protein